MTIEEFIEARIAEDEQIARSSIDPERPGAHWCWEDGERDPLQPGVEVEGLDTQAISLRTVEEYPTRDVGELPAFIISQVEARLPGGLWHIVRHDPARALIEIAAKRHALGFALAAFNQESKIEERPGRDPEANAYDKGRADTARFMLRVLAAPYAEHPDFQAVWAVDTGGSKP